jgi:transcriptional regulator with PAS, ATPase and Fis domain
MDSPTVIHSPTIHTTVPHHEVEESLSLEDREVELITRALQKHRGKRKNAAKELGISERTLYRKIKEYNIKA